MFTVAARMHDLACMSAHGRRHAPLNGWLGTPRYCDVVPDQPSKDNFKH